MIQSSIGQFTNTIAQTTAESVSRCFNLGSNLYSVKEEEGRMPHSTDLHDKVARSIGMTGHSMMTDKAFAGNRKIRRDLRNDMGEPTKLLFDGETIGNKRRRLGKDNSSSRAVRNNLHDGIGDSTKNKIDINSMFERVKGNLFQRFRFTNDVKSKTKIKHALKELKKGNEDSFLYSIFEMSSSNEGAQPQDVANDILSFIDDNEL